jgi:hypothetical protein
MRLVGIQRSLSVVVFALALAVGMQAQQDNSTAIEKGGQAAPPAASSNAPASAPNAPATSNVPPAPDTTAQPATSYSTSAEDNPYDPILEPPPLPKGRTTLIGGIAVSVDHVRNHITVQPFGRGQKVKVIVDERSHIYRNGTPTTILGVRKGDRVYVDTMFDASNDKVLARNIRVVTETGLAEVRGQVIATNSSHDTITVRDLLSAKPVTFAIGSATSYSSSKGSVSAGDVQPGALIDVQFAPRRGDQDMARAINIVAKPGDNYVFAGVVTNLDLRTDSLFLDNKSDDQNYELHFTPADVADLQQLKVGSQVTARATFDGKQYKASNIRIDNSAEQPGEQSKAQ